MESTFVEFRRVRRIARDFRGNQRDNLIYESRSIENRAEQAVVILKPLDFVVRHVILDVVSERKWIRAVGREREVDFDTGPVFGDAIKAIVGRIHNAEPADLKAEMVTHISDNSSVAIGRVNPQFAASVGLIFDAPDRIERSEKLRSPIVVRFCQTVPPVVLLNFVDEELEAVITHIVRSLTE